MKGFTRILIGLHRQFSGSPKTPQLRGRVSYRFLATSQNDSVKSEFVFARQEKRPGFLYFNLCQPSDSQYSDSHSLQEDYFGLKRIKQNKTNRS